jgi:hypothetical protein
MRNFIANNCDTNYRFENVYSEGWSEVSEKLLVARNLFDLREFKKCSHLLKEYVE